jgi:ketosteroid isomerase-like protein
MYQAVFTQMHVRQEFASAELIVAGDWAIDRGIEHFELTPKAGGQSQHVGPRRALTMLRRQADGTWRFARGMTNDAESPAP